MEFDPLTLSRVQFAFTVSFHILFPSFTIGLAAWLAVLEGLWLATRRPVYMDLARFWTKVFAVSFGMGVVSGIVMSYEFGTNWSRFSELTGNILGPLLSYEVLTAFFLEASFLGVMLFGWNRVPEKLHFAATCIVALGTLISAFWILSANSWMQTPAGYVLEDGVFYARDWMEIVFNPSFPYRLVHMVVAAYLTTGFVVAGVGAYYLLRQRSVPHARVMLAMGIGLAAVLAPAQIVIGDLHGLNVRDHQPLKLAAMEGHWETQRGAPMILFAWPDEEAETNHFELAIPKLGSLILTHDWNGEVTGLKNWAPEDRPDVPLVFWSFRIMVAIGLAMLGLAAAGLIEAARGRLYRSATLHRLMMAAIPLGFVAVLAGWITAEAGRQPWLVYGLMRTAEGVSPVPGGSVALSLALFVIVYGIIFGAGLTYIVALIRRGPALDQGRQEAPPAGTPARPLSAAGAGTAREG